MLAEYIFIYHLDAELHKLYLQSSRYSTNQVNDTFSLALRIAFLLCKKSIIIPASNYFESDIAYKNINVFAPLITYDVVHLISKSGSLDLLLEKKKVEHEGCIDSNQYHYKDYWENENGLLLPGSLHQRDKSSSNEIRKKWLDSIGDTVVWGPYFESIDNSISYKKFEKALSSIPERLEKKAYISNYITPMLGVDSKIYKITDRFVNVFITKEYIKNFLLEYENATALCDIPFINSTEILPQIPGREYISYSKYAGLLHNHRYKGSRTIDYLLHCSALDLLEYKESKQWKSIVYPEGKDNIKYSVGGIIVSNLPMIKTGIFFALPEEFAAFKALVNPVSRLGTDVEKALGIPCYTGSVKGSDNKDHIIGMFLLPEYGNNMASIYATKAKNVFYQMEHIILCGIAGGIPQKEHIGDVVVSTEGVFEYDYGKNERKRFIIKDHGAPCSLVLKEAVRLFIASEFQNKIQWKEKLRVIKNTLNASFSAAPTTESFYARGLLFGKYGIKKRPGKKEPTIHYGRIASGNCVQKDPRKRDKLYAQEQVFAIEMEGAGIKDVARVNNVGYLVVRGICDFCDDEKNDNSHNYASATAAIYTLGLLESMQNF